MFPPCSCGICWCGEASARELSNALFYLAVDGGASVAEYRE